jgi:hypothetical protein
VNVAVHVSDDGGATWTTVTKSCGNYNDGRTDGKTFHYIKNGQFFVFKVEWPSSTADFQFLGFDVTYEENGEEF